MVPTFKYVPDEEISKHFGEEPIEAENSTEN